MAWEARVNVNIIAPFAAHLTNVMLMLKGAPYNRRIICQIVSNIL
jgi:hypothetical protein